MAMAHQVLELRIFIIFAAFLRTTYTKTSSWALDEPLGSPSRYYLSWRLAVEASNVRVWQTVPLQCLRHVKSYITGSQYKRDLDLIVDQIGAYVDGIDMSEDGMDAWILDVDDSCVSNLPYYRGEAIRIRTVLRSWIQDVGGEKRMPGDPHHAGALLEADRRGFKVILPTGRDEESLGEATFANLWSQGYIGYERLIMRSATYKGQSAVTYKSATGGTRLQDLGQCW